MDPTGVRLLMLDVDGVLTDGRVAPTADDEWGKRFHVHDGCAIKLWKRCGGKAAILSGREGRDVARRAAELGIEWVMLGVSDKLAGYEAIRASADCADAAVAYVGDDLPDLGPMSRCAWPVAVADAVPAVKRAAQYVTRRTGGCGAVAEVIELILRKQKRWSPALLREM
jgi:3-deoxy-D-manno-octulosonate 8-phosphate phosphatase (KDO 8-P phosphatase)